MQVYIIDNQNIFVGSAEIDPMRSLPPCVMVAPPETTGDEVAQWTGTEWTVLPQRPAPNPAPQWAFIRFERNAKLAASDWTQLPDSPISNVATQAWATYRQALRDITEQSDPFSITWPEEPR